MGSHHRPKVPRRQTSTREKTEEKIPRCATRNNRALLKMPPGRVSTLTKVLSMSSSPLKPLQQAQDSHLHGLASCLLLACSPCQGARTSSSSNKPDLSRNNHLLLQHLSLRDKRVTPMPEQTLQLGASLGTNHLLEHPNNLVVTPVATPAVLPTSPNSSRRSPTACSTSPRSPPGPPSPSSASLPSSASSPACPASSSSPPSTWRSPPLSSACPYPPCPQATSSTPPSPSSTPSAPSSSFCPACTSSMYEASPLEILLVGAFGSPAPTQLGTIM